jgi:hypothetical protein
MKKIEERRKEEKNADIKKERDEGGPGKNKRWLEERGKDEMKAEKTKERKNVSDPQEI